MWIKGEYHANFDSVQEVARGALDRLDAANAELAGGQAGLFDRLSWFRNLHRFCAPRSLPLIVRSRAEHTDMWLFLVYQSRTHLKSLTNWYSFHFRPVFTGDLSSETRQALVKGAAKRLRKKFSRITLTAVPQKDGTLKLLESGFGKAGWLVISDALDTNHYLHLDGRDFAQYWAARPGALRSTVERKAKKGPVDIVIHEQFDANAWADYERVYAQSWKPAEGNPAFLQALAEAEGEAGALRLGIAKRDGQAVAAQFWTVEHGVANIHKLAHVRDDDNLSPGTLLSEAMFRHVIDQDKVGIIDFGTGDDAYKRDWMESSDRLYQVDLFNLSKPQSWLPAIRESLSHLWKSRSK